MSKLLRNVKVKLPAALGGSKSDDLDDLLFDADEEVKRNLWKQRKLLPPDTPRRNAWDALLMLFVFYNLLTIPLMLLYWGDFYDELPDRITLPLFVVDRVLDCFFLADIIMNFRTFFYQGDPPVLMSSNKDIALHYMKSWFVLDLIATVPWDMIDPSVRALKLTRLLRVGRIFKLLDKMKNANALHTLLMGISFVLIVHWVGGGYWAIGTVEATSYSSSDISASTIFFAPNDCAGEAGCSSVFLDPKDDAYQTGTSWLLRVPPVGNRANGLGNYTAYQQCVQNCLNSTDPSDPSVRVADADEMTKLLCLGEQGPYGLPGCDENNMIPVNKENYWSGPSPPNLGPLNDMLTQQYLTSFYWAMTMLMKTPYVHPDTVAEKVYCSIMVIVGALTFAVILGKISQFIASLDKSGAQLRDLLTQNRVFLRTRKVDRKIANQLIKFNAAEFDASGGTDAMEVLSQFPEHVRGAVIVHCHPELMGMKPAFLSKAGDMLLKRILELIKPTIAMKKQVILRGNQYDAMIYLLVKGSLQVSMTPPTATAAAEASRNTDDSSERDSPNYKKCSSKMSKLMSDAPSTPSSMCEASFTRQQSRSSKMMQSHSWKSKMRVRMLEKTGAIVAPADVFAGKRKSRFEVNATSQSHYCTIDCTDLARVLDSYPQAEAAVVSDSLAEEHKALVKSLEKRDTKTTIDEEEDSTRMSRRSTIGAGKAPVRLRSAEERKDPVIIAGRVEALEARMESVLLQVGQFKAMATLLPTIHAALQQRSGSAAGSSSAATFTKETEQAASARKSKDFTVVSDSPETDGPAIAHV